MQPSRMHCPHCQVVLRIRDRRHIGRQVACPDCGQPIQVLADGPQKLQLVKADVQPPPGRSGEDSSATAAVATLTPAVAQQTSSQPSQLQKCMTTLTSATGIAWSVAVVCGLILLVLAGPFQSNEVASPPDQPETETATPDVGPPEPAGVTPKEPSDAPRAVAGLQPRLEHLGSILMEFVDEHERFPSSSTAAPGMTEEQRLSWLAELVADIEPDSQPLWDQSWRDPLNDRFVRRTLAEFQNPNLKQPTGPDRYPSTHFVGIAGVGPDGARLPVDHRRAGVFGVGRRTRLSDIKDGQTNTMMIAGVARNIGRWAGSGSSTMRPLTREPYIDGPDGFGTGEVQGMSVLMADGSVRFLAKGTDPRLFRRMAAIADGFPLDLKVPGEPGDQPPSPPAVDPKEPVAQAKPDRPAQPAADDDALRTAAPVVAPVPPRIIDVGAALSQPILQYEQTKSTPLRVVLLEVEEMIGVPIRFDEKELGANANQLMKSVRVQKLENTTAGEILTALLNQAGLAFDIEQNAIRVKIQ